MPEGMLGRIPISISPHPDSSNLNASGLERLNAINEYNVERLREMEERGQRRRALAFQHVEDLGFDFNELQLARLEQISIGWTVRTNWEGVVDGESQARMMRGEEKVKPVTELPDGGYWEEEGLDI
jgi:hypothetical protein